MTHAPLVLSGMQPTNTLHLGNYLGALKNWVRMQEEMPCLFCVVDMHAITADAGYGKPGELAQATREVTAAYIAAGVDPKRTPIFNQGQVPEHGELAWIFNCVARVGWLDRMTQFKDKSGKNKESASVGLYTYPVLQAADILLYKATHVPVGDDQKQHVELTRDIAAKFNHDFNVPGYFPLPEPIHQGAGARIMSLRNASEKMSKSNPSDAARINLTDDADAIAQKIRRAKTDPLPMPETTSDAEKRPDADNLLGIYAALADMEKDAVIFEFAGKQFSEFKAALTETAVAKLGPIGSEMQRLMKDPGHVDKVLHEGAQKARALAEPILADVYKTVGFLKP